MQQIVLEIRKEITNNIEYRMRIQSLWTVLNNWLLLKPRFGLLQCRGRFFNILHLFQRVEFMGYILLCRYSKIYHDHPIQWKTRIIIDNLILISAVCQFVHSPDNYNQRFTCNYDTFPFFLRSYKISLSIYVTCAFQYLPSADIKARLKSRYLLP